MLQPFRAVADPLPPPAAVRLTQIQLYRRRARHAAPPVNEEGTLTHGARLRLHDVLGGPCLSWVKLPTWRKDRVMSVLATDKGVGFYYARRVISSRR